MFKTTAIAAAVVLTSGLSFARIPGRAVQSPAVRPAAAAETPAPVVPARTIVLRNVDVKKLKKIVAREEPIALPLTGEGFEANMRGTLTSLNEIVAFGSNAVSSVSPTAFTLTVSLPRPGAYQLTVSTPDGRRSNTLRIDAVAR